MNRGFFSIVAETEAYKNADKEWFVELQQYHKYWYDLVVNPHEVAEYFDSRQLIVDYLKRIKAAVEAGLEKRFIYFICSRERVRFNIKKTPSYNRITRSTKFHVLIGKNKIKKTIRCKFFDMQRQKFYHPKIELTEKYITITDAQNHNITLSIHDFLEDANIFLGLDSNVEYVGYTKNPESRPTNGGHTGLSDTLYRQSENCRDSFIYFNLFKIITRADDEVSMLSFAFANSMTDEVDVELEGKLLEKCFIFYFDAAGQNRNKKNELSELDKNLRRISKEQKINKIRIHYEIEKKTEYAIFSSSKVRRSTRHMFTVQTNDRGVEIVNELGQTRPII